MKTKPIQFPEENLERRLAYPPGGLLIWIIIFLELITFGLGIMALFYYGMQEPEVFRDGAARLNRSMGTLNTVVLLSSGYLMAKAVYSLKAGHSKRSFYLLLATLGGGLLFTLIKGLEYKEKLAHQFSLGGNMFETLYWLMTGFHLIHVWVGMVILFIVGYPLRKPKAKINVLDLEAGGAFWHMCDLIWLILFPALYLLY